MYGEDCKCSRWRCTITMPNCGLFPQIGDLENPPLVRLQVGDDEGQGVRNSWFGRALDDLGQKFTLAYYVNLGSGYRGIATCLNSEWKGTSGSAQYGVRKANHVQLGPGCRPDLPISRRRCMPELHGANVPHGQRDSRLAVLGCVAYASLANSMFGIGIEGVNT